MLKKGDVVSLIDEPLTGIVVAVKGEEITLETEQGFLLSFLSTEVVKIDQGAMELPSYQQVYDNLQQKEDFKKKTKKKAPIKRKERNLPPMEVDLHIHKLVKSKKGMSNYDILTIQLDTAERQLNFAIAKRIPRIVFIHGVGQGVLKEELKTLFRRFDNIRISEADYKKYGLGATEIYIVQNPNK
ncbi:Smr/MutS family protein [Aquimarina hainanensis]|uniref:Smr/MutS family protein n=1 Tax=Aquimarina hainanensis TaxID=1578017 RepID=A0ABW5ND94_9FLAO|nr:Smr/MutS family protein [Aquimarina sp. TRL1]QKX07206.1 Smr/MutS family protein [Aquimarina sp. TRL1]